MLLRGRQWQDLSRTLSGFLAVAPADPMIREDLVRLALLLPAIAPLRGPALAAQADPSARRAGAVLSGAVGLATELADNGARSFAKVARRGDVYLPARLLTGAEITDDPGLVHARLLGKIVRASEARLDQVAVLYRELRADPRPTVHSAHSPIPTHSTHRTVEPIGMSVRAGSHAT